MVEPRRVGQPVFAGDLEGVGEVEPGGVDVDEDLSGAGLGIGDGFESEVFGGTEGAAEEGLHDGDRFLGGGEIEWCDFRMRGIGMRGGS